MHALVGIGAFAIFLAVRRVTANLEYDERIGDDEIRREQLRRLALKFDAEPVFAGPCPTLPLSKYSMSSAPPMT
jgi:hypothetical protein